MARTEMMIVSMRELHRLKTIQAVVDGLLPVRMAAERLSIPDRQVRRLCRYQAGGFIGLISRHRGRPNKPSYWRVCVLLALYRQSRTLHSAPHTPV